MRKSRSSAEPTIMGIVEKHQAAVAAEPRSRVQASANVEETQARARADLPQNVTLPRRVRIERRIAVDQFDGSGNDLLAQSRHGVAAKT